MKKRQILSVLMALAMLFSLLGGISTNTSAAAKRAAKISMSKSKATVEVGKKTKMKVTVKPKGAKVTIIWKSSNKKIAKVNKKGYVTGVKPGTVTITARAKSGNKILKAKRKVMVTKPKQVTATVPVTGILFEKRTMTLDAGKVEQLKVNISPSNATNKALTFTSTNPNVASVDAKGIVTAKAQGETTITAKATDGSNKSDSIKISVTAITKPRALVTQDGECDDMNSLLHILLYSNEIDIRGIVHTSSSAGHWEGVEGVEQQSNAPAGSDCTKPYRWPGTDWMYEYIDSYAKVYPNLIKHDSAFPTPDYLRSVTKVGNIGYVNDTRYSTEGSKLVEKEILANDDRVLYLMAWGGPNTIARALMDIQEKYKNTDGWKALKESIMEKVIITGCFEQDNTYEKYICEEWPQMAYINTAQMSATAFGWTGSPDDENKETYTGKWMAKNLVKNHGALLDQYMTWGDGKFYKGELDCNQFGYYDELLGSDRKTYFPDAWISGDHSRYDFISEGDSPCWLMLINNGLRDKGSVEALANGGYSGRYQFGKGAWGPIDKDPKNTKGESINYWSPINDNYTYENGTTKSISSEWKWVSSIMNDFAARADWCITNDYSKANHSPSVSIIEGVDFTAEAGKTLKLHAVTSDPDNDYVSVGWTYYADASTYEGENVVIKGADSDTASIIIPSDAKSGDKIYVNVKAQDDGEHTLVHYQQVIITVQ